ncbi:pfs domain-containing protein [Colletotrichum musicola]|uniref:Pfs domain-containing protein n=1 Tax=Colletotrichum musicola TaxID=2175873 RepID=A0A8H6MSD9_9PEZI|nr:pfs domain-containing protein [Colletotrichum musicola]
MIHHRHVARVYCVIDGLDVYEDPEMIDLVDGLRKIWKSHTNSKTNASIFCTSRPMRQLLDAWDPSEYCKLRCNRTDITTFIEQRVLRLGPAFSDGLKSSIKTQLLSRSEQSFLWLDVVIRRIQDLELPTPAEVNQEIESSSHDLYDLYRYLIQRAATRSRRLVQILVMVVYAKRPLRCDELEHAAATDVSPVSDKQTYQDFVQGVAHLNDRNVTQTLGTLLDVVDGWVLVIHQSLKDFIRHNWESLSLPISISPEAYPAI